MEQNDWRLTNQSDYLMEKELLHIPYEPYRQDWTHDHCEFCNEKIDSSTGVNYCTTDKYHWICNECFEDFQKTFKWQVVGA